MAAGFTTGQPFHAAMYVFAVASMAYLECTRNPGKDLVITLSDKQKTTLTPRRNCLPLPGATIRRRRPKRPGRHHPVEG